VKIRILLTVLAATFATGSLSCGGGAKHYHPTVKMDPIPLMIWVDPSSDLPKEDMLKACEEWRVMGIQCHLVTNKSSADVRVYSDTKDACARNKNGNRTVARAWQGGRIVFYRKCYGKMRSKSARRKFRAIGTHEVGHQLGIWDHVPESCDGKKVKTHPSKKKVCGKAVMNAMYDKNVYRLTLADKLAFDLRDRLIGVVSDVHRKPVGKPACIYYSK